MIEYSKVYFTREGKEGVMTRKGVFEHPNPPLDTLLICVGCYIILSASRPAPHSQQLRKRSIDLLQLHCWVII